LAWPTSGGAATAPRVRCWSDARAPEAAAPPTPTPAREPITLKYVIFVPKNVSTIQPGWHFIDLLAERTDEIIVEFVGGPEAIPGEKQFEALTTGVVDMGYLATSYHTPQVPENLMVLLCKAPPWRARETGFQDLINKRYNEEIAYMLGMPDYPDVFRIYTNVKPMEPYSSFQGQKLRVAPHLLPWVEALGASSTYVPIPDVYTALERGVIDGVGYSWYGLTDFGWHEVLKYAVDHTVYYQSLVFLVNLDSWNKIPQDLQQIMIDTMIDTEKWAADFHKEMAEKERQTMVDAGVEFITFSPADAEWYVKQAYDALLASIEKDASPEYFSQLRELVDKE